MSDASRLIILTRTEGRRTPFARSTYSAEIDTRGPTFIIRRASTSDNVGFEWRLRLIPFVGRPVAYRCLTAGGRPGPSEIESTLGSSRFFENNSYQLVRQNEIKSLQL